MPAVINRLEGTVAVIEVVELAVIARLVVWPPNVQLTTGEAVAKLAPVRVRLKLDCPTAAVFWLNPESVGAEEIAKVWVPGAETEPFITPT